MDARLPKTEARIQADQARAGIVVEQKAIRELPPAQQLKQQVDAVQTMIQRKDETLVMTLYLDRPVSDSILQGASIESVGADSVVVQLGNQLIGYKLPSKWGEQLTRQVKVRR